MRKKKRKIKNLTRHHLIPKERIKLHNLDEDEPKSPRERVLMLWENHHIYWHYLFKNLTLREIIKVLQRIDRMKLN